jgi:hypothetical protein
VFDAVYKFNGEQETLRRMIPPFFSYFVHHVTPTSHQQFFGPSPSQLEGSDICRSSKFTVRANTDEPWILSIRIPDLSVLNDWTWPASELSSSPSTQGKFDSKPSKALGLFNWVSSLSEVTSSLNYRM